jgi:TetR/AcrR family transcriptional repressor of nem operon
MASRKAAHNQKVRAALIEAAARLFRQHGVGGTGIDAICGQAGLTRGAFYAHFPSKEALLRLVLADMHPLLTRLRRLPDGDAAGLASEFSGYLDPANLEEVKVGCRPSCAPDSAAHVRPFWPRWCGSQDQTLTPPCSTRR